MESVFARTAMPEMWGAAPPRYADSPTMSETNCRPGDRRKRWGRGGCTGDDEPVAVQDGGRLRSRGEPLPGSGHLIKERHGRSGGVRDPELAAAEREPLRIRPGRRAPLHAQVVLAEPEDDAVWDHRDPDEAPADRHVAGPAVELCLGRDSVLDRIDFCDEAVLGTH